MKLNHIDLQVPDVQEAVTFFERWFDFKLTTSKSSPAIAILDGDDGFVLVLQRRAVTYPEDFHIGFLVDSPDTVIDFQRRAREAGLEISDVDCNNRGTMAYLRGPGRVLIEVSCRRARS
jgi:catechol 2,3-dioxygenase-like lactoylglutathione lyase family enzyme